MSLLFKCQGEKGQKKFAVLEIDEASLSRVTKYIQPKLFVLRIFSATKWIAMVKFTTYRLIMEGAAAAPEATILCNGDSPILIQKKL